MINVGRVPSGCIFRSVIVLFLVVLLLVCFFLFVCRMLIFDEIFVKNCLFKLSLEVGSYFFDIGCSDKSLIINGVRIDSIGESGMIREEEKKIWILIEDVREDGIVQVGS